MSMVKIRRGNKSNLPVFALAELGFSADTKELFIGNGTNNTQIAVNIRFNNGNIEVYDGVSWKIYSPPASVSQFNFDNAGALAGNQRDFITNPDGNFYEFIKNISTSKLVAERTTITNGDGSMTIKETIYADDGTTITRNTIDNIYFTVDTVDERVTIV